MIMGSVSLPGFIAQIEISAAWFQPQTHSHQSSHCIGWRPAKRAEAVQQGHTYMQLHHLPLTDVGHDSLTQVFAAVHLGLHQAAQVVATSDLPDTPSKAFADLLRFFSMG